MMYAVPARMNVGTIRTAITSVTARPSMIEQPRSPRRMYLAMTGHPDSKGCGTRAGAPQPWERSSTAGPLLLDPIVLGVPVLRAERRIGHKVVHLGVLEPDVAMVEQRQVAGVVLR